ncbi:MAG: hypothetical protein IJS32_05580 [Kiritimatiellae bacterium]|nr:hypothetical protein [Kiritimatiellia bacterium]
MGVGRRAGARRRTGAGRMAENGQFKTRAAGFANYPAEWWHFAFGDRLWAACRGKRRAIYGPVEAPGGGEIALDGLRPGGENGAG